MAAPIQAGRDFRLYTLDDGYEVSRDGVVRNVATGKVLTRSGKSGKPSVSIGGKSVYLKLVVARTWLPFDPARRCILHEDHDINNCRAENLRWAMHAECMAHARDNPDQPPPADRCGIPIESYGVGVETVTYVSIKEAARATGVSETTIGRRLNDGLPDPTGRRWRSTAPAVLPGEEWREIRECDGFVFACHYDVSNQERAKGPCGPIYPSLGHDGYMHLPLRILDGAGNATSRNFKYHRLVATAFHGPPPTPGLEVNHMNGVPTNNRPENLERNTKIENMTHAKGRPVVQKNGAGEVIARYKSLAEAAEAVGRADTAIGQAIKRRGTSAGFYWENAAAEAVEEAEAA